MPNTGTVSGLTLVNDINACNGSLLSLYSGLSAPSAPTIGMLWYDTGTNYIRQFDGASFQPVWFVDATNHLTTQGIGGGVVSAAVTAAATTDVGSVSQSFVTVNGNTNISSFGLSAVTGSMHVISFTGTPILIYNPTSLIIPGQTSVQVAPGDVAFALYLGLGNWQILFYQPVTGSSLVNTAVPLGTVYFGTYGTVPPKTVLAAGQALLRSSFPAFTAAVSRTQSMTRTSGNATLASVTNTSGFGAGMPVEGPGIAVGCTIASLVANTSITLNSTSCVTASGSVSITVFLTGYGSGGSVATVGVADCRGRTLAGRDDLGTVPANRLTNSVMTPNGNAVLATGGSQTVTLAIANLPPYTPAGSITDGAITINGTAASLAGGNNNNGGGGGSFGAVGSNAVGFTASQGTSTFTGNAMGGNSTPFSTTQPTITADCVQVVLP
jgi:hypothetical protein